MYSSLQKTACLVRHTSISNSITKLNDVSRGELEGKVIQIKNSSISHRSQLSQTPHEELKHKSPLFSRDLANDNITTVTNDNRAGELPNEKMLLVDFKPQSINAFNKDPIQKLSFADSIVAARNNLNKAKNTHHNTQIKQSTSGLELLSELRSKLEKINNGKLCCSNIVKNNDIGTNKIQLEIAKLREEYEREAPKRAYAEAKEELRVAIALDLEKKESVREKIKAGASDELVNPIIIAFDERGIPLPPPLPTIQNINKIKFKIEAKVNPVSSRQAVDSLSVSLLKELSEKLIKRNNDNLFEMKSEKNDGDIKNKFALEIAKLREEYERDAPIRAEAEAKEELRVAMAEAKEKNEDILTRKVSQEPLHSMSIKYDESGIPVAPPLPMASKN